MLIKRLAKSFFQHGFAGHSTSAGSSSRVRPFFKKQDISITVLQESQCTSLFFLCTAQHMSRCVFIEEDHVAD